MDTNLKGAWLVSRAAAKRMIEAKLEGSIVNIASILGFRVAGQVAPYAASKAGLLQLTRALAFEWARTGSASTRSHRAISRPTSTATSSPPIPARR